MSIMAVQR